MKVSIAIPCYEMSGRGDFFLNFCLQKIANQTYKNLEIVVSDHSKTDIVKKVADQWNESLDIKYYRFKEKFGNSSANTNNAIKHCTGEIIKILCQDDYLYDDRSIETIVHSFTDDTQWLVSDYIHTNDHTNLYKVKRPRYNHKIHIKNTIGTHSCLAIRNNLSIYFDEQLIWFMDCEYYKRLYERFGQPKLLKKVTMVQYLWDGQVTNTLANRYRRLKEFSYLENKYASRMQNEFFSKIFGKVEKKILRFR